MKTVFKKMLSLVLVAMLLVSAVPFQASAATGDSVRVPVYLYAEGADTATTRILIEFTEGDQITPSDVASRLKEAGYTLVGFPAGLTWDSMSIQSESEIRVVVSEIDPPSTNDNNNNNTNNDNNDDDDDNDTDTVTNTVTVRVWLADADTDNYKEYKTYTVNSAPTTKDQLADIMGRNNFQLNRLRSNSDGTVDAYIYNVATGGKNIYTIKVYRNNGTTDYEKITALEGEYLLDVLDDNDISYSRSGYKFMGWYMSSKFSNDNIATARTKVTGDMEIYAAWDKTSSGEVDYDDYSSGSSSSSGSYSTEEGKVYLGIYLNGNTSTMVKIVDVSKYAEDNYLDQWEAEKTVKKYYSAKSGYTLKFDGLFDWDLWQEYKKDDDTDGKASYKLKRDSDGDLKEQYYYVMVWNAKSSSSSTADSSNPKTGDNIMMATTVMTLTATAIAAAYVMSKKRATK